MARIAGVNIPTGKRVVIALQYIHGIGASKAKEIVEKVNITPERRVNELSDAEGLPFVGWATATGDLRPAHFLSLHAMQVLPLFGLWLDRRGTVHAVRPVRLAAVGYSLLTMAVFAQALLGLPRIPLG